MSGKLRGVVLVAALLAILWLARHPSRPSVLRRAEITTAAGPVTPSRSAPRSPPAVPRAVHRLSTTTQASVEMPDWRVPLDQAIAKLEELAETGNTRAQLELSSRLEACTPHSLREAARQDEYDRESIESDAHNESLAEGLRSVRLSNSQGRLDQNAAVRDACAKLPPDLVVHWLDPVDRAAQSGDTAAMRAYARMAIAAYDSVDAIVADVDNAIIRRDKARAYLLDAFRLGDQHSLVELAEAYGGGVADAPRLFAEDPFQTYAYAYAGTLAGIRQGNELDSLMSQSAQLLDPTQLAAAQSQGHRIYEQCCARR